MPRILVHILISIIIIFSISLSSVSTETFAQAPIKDGIQCDIAEHFNIHFHAHLDIMINGMSYIIPGGIGIRPSECIYWLHTHDTSGIIHVEAPENRTFTLGQFFNVWDQKFNNTQIFNFTVHSADSENKALNVYVDGTKVEHLAYRDIPISNHEEIAIVYGTPPPNVPSSYDFQY